MAPINLPGVGQVPDHFSIASRGVVNLEQPNVKNYRNENQVVAQCGHDKWVDDNFDVTGQKLSDGKYKLSVAMQSEIVIKVFSDSRVDLLYDPKTQRWSMTAWVDHGKTEWKFCDAGAMIDIVTAGLDCLKGSPAAKPYSDAITHIAQSVRSGKALLAADAHKYTARTDCTVELTSHDPCPSAWCPSGAAGD